MWQVQDVKTEKYILYIGLAKKCLQFLSKNKRHISHFHQELY